MFDLIYCKCCACSALSEQEWQGWVHLSLLCIPVTVPLSRSIIPIVPCQANPGLLLGTKAPVMTPNGVDFSTSLLAKLRDVKRVEAMDLRDGVTDERERLWTCKLCTQKNAAPNVKAVSDINVVMQAVAMREYLTEGREELGIPSSPRKSRRKGRSQGGRPESWAALSSRGAASSLHSTYVLVSCCMHTSGSLNHCMPFHSILLAYPGCQDSGVCLSTQLCRL